MHAPLKSAPAEHREWRLAAAHCRDADALRRCVCREASFAGDSGMVCVYYSRIIYFNPSAHFWMSLCGFTAE